MTTHDKQIARLQLRPEYASAGTELPTVQKCRRPRRPTQKGMARTSLQRTLRLGYRGSSNGCSRSARLSTQRSSSDGHPNLATSRR